MITTVRPMLCAFSVLFLSLAAASCLRAEGDAAADNQAKILGQAGTPVAQSRNKHPDAQWFPEAGLGLFIHWGLTSQDAKGDLSWGMLANKPWKDATITPNEYYASAKRWKPDAMNYDAILAEAKKAGVTYAVMVTKHHDGFTFWPSAYGDIGTKQTFGGRDFVKEFTDACRKNGIKVGLYYSPPDWWFDRLYKNFSFRGGQKLDMDHKPVTLPPKPADHDKKRAELVRNQVTELLTKYGKIDLIWFDGGHGEIPNAEVRRLQPGIIINKRNGGGGDYGDSETALPAKRFSGWFETCATCWPSRKWTYTEEYGFDSAALALTKLVLLRAWGGNLLANVGPKGDGSLSPQTHECWSEMAKWMSHSRESVIGAKPGPWPSQGDQTANLPITTREGIAYVHFLPKFPERYPGTPDDEKKLSGTREILRSLPEETDTFVWKNAPKPTKATLLRTGEAVPFTYENGELTITLDPKQRTPLVDVVKLQLTP